MIDLKTIIDLVMVALLLATIIFCYVLHKRLSAFRAQRQEFEVVVQKLFESTRAAESSIKTLRIAADETNRTLGERLAVARTVNEELAFMLDRASPLVDKLHGLISSARPVADTAMSGGGKMSAVEATLREAMKVGS